VHIYQSGSSPGEMRPPGSCHAERTSDRLFVNQGHLSSVLRTRREAESDGMAGDGDAHRRRPSGVFAVIPPGVWTGPANLAAFRCADAELYDEKTGPYD